MPPPTIGLSVCCVSDQPPERLTAVLANVREVADEVVLGVDEHRFRSAERSYRQLADRVVSVTADLPWGVVYGACAGEWTLGLDGNEVVSGALTRRLPRLIEDPDMQQWAIRRRWVFPDPAHWIDEVPWAPDFQLRLLRKGARSFSRTLPAEADVAPPVGYVDEPIYTLECIVSDQQERQARALLDDVLRPGRAGVGHRQIHELHDPEAFTSLPPADVPEEDRAVIARCLSVRAAA